MKVKVVHQEKSCVDEHGHWKSPGYHFDMDNSCCDDMSDALEDDGPITRGEVDNYGNEISKLIVYSVSIYPEGPVFTEYEIDYCPFCGAKIEYEII